MHDMSALSSSPFMIQRLEKQGDVAQYLSKACPQVASVKDSLNGIGPHRRTHLSETSTPRTATNAALHPTRRHMFAQFFYRIFRRLRLHQTTAIDGAVEVALTPSLALSQSQSMFTSPALANTFPRAISLPD